ncbi:alpha-ketoglutarate-dependent dioxygenase alkb [Quercus suber]|uniref:Alpha-ketoglutarate-dependent dioxygenase alkb n=2 Tax=Quercus suber TaxID=58331 RepID=A0AAW0ITE6_QUESU
MHRGTGHGRAKSTGANWVKKETGGSVHCHSPVGAVRLAEETVGGEDGSSIGKRNNSQQRSLGSVPKNSEYKPKLGSKNWQKWHSRGGKDGFANIVRSQQGINSPVSVGSRSKQFKCMGTPDSAQKQDFPQLSGWSDSEDLDTGRIQSGKILCVGTADSITLQDDLPNQAGPSNKGASLEVNMEFKLKISVHQVETRVLSVSAKKYEPSSSKDPKSSAGHKNLEHSEHSAVLDSFDLCPTKSEKTVMLNPPLLVQNRERRNEIKSSLEGQNGVVLRAGMVLLKSYLSFSDQVKIVKKCRDLGLGPGGFYQRGYRGSKLRWKMYLGKNWDPETGNYGDYPPVDEAKPKPPTIPAEFYRLVKKSIEDSHSLIQKNSKSSNVESILPWMSPNICLVNYYSENGRLGLHQDRRESQESLAKGLPVVSFSIGDKADFLYGDQRDVDKADRVVLESGDVLIFGGKSRHIFHGVTAIHPNSAPKSLLEETKLRPGRLNLSFRQY